MTAETVRTPLVQPPSWSRPDPRSTFGIAGDFGAAWEPRRVMPAASVALGIATIVLVALTGIGEIGRGFAFRDLTGLLVLYAVALAIIGRTPWGRLGSDWLLGISAVQVLFVVSLASMTGGSSSAYFALYAPVLALAGWHLRLAHVSIVVAMVGATEIWRALVVDGGAMSDQLSVALPLYATLAFLAHVVAARLTGAIVTIRHDQRLTAETLTAIRAMVDEREGDLLTTLAAEARRIHGCDARAVAFEPPTPPGDPVVADADGGRLLTVTVSGGSGTYGLLELQRSRPFTSGEARLVSILADAWGRAMDTHRLFDELRNQTKRDPLTGLLNRRALEDDLNGRVRRALDDRVPVVLAYVDIDDMKGINDGYGHDAGDRMIREVARQLAMATRETERVYRVGGDEFVVVAVDVDRQTAPKLAARLSAAAHTSRRRSSDRPGSPRVTLSVGVVVADRPDADPQELLRTADESMYRAKQRGGDGADVAGAPTA